MGWPERAARSSFTAERGGGKHSMGSLSSTDERTPGSVQARCLTQLLASHNLSAREVARRSKVIAQEFSKPELVVSHQAVSAWLNGTRHPTTNHKQLLAMIIGVPLTEIVLSCDIASEPSDLQLDLRHTTVVVPTIFQEYRYNLPVRKEIDLGQPAIYSDWKQMFNFPPAGLMRHLRNIRSEAFGWIPDDGASPMIHYSRCLVLIERMPNRRVSQTLDSAESCQRRVWFVYLPGGHLQVGIGYRRNRSFVLARNVGNRLAVQEFPLSRVDLVGHAIGNVVFYLMPTDQGTASGSVASRNVGSNGLVTH